MTLHFKKFTVFPVGIVIILAIIVVLLMLPTNHVPISPLGSASSVAYETASIEVLFISPEVNGEFQEVGEQNGPEGPMPTPPGKGPLRIFALEEATRKIVELRNQAGEVIARVTWTLSDLSGFLDDWKGEKVWSSKIEVFSGYGSNGLGFWLWKMSERIFNQPGITRIFVDMSRTSSGRTGWMTYHLPEFLDFVQQNVSSFNYLLDDPNLGVWIIQYP